jgi:hypothetical protein
MFIVMEKEEGACIAEVMKLMEYVEREEHRLIQIVKTHGRYLKIENRI